MEPELTTIKKENLRKSNQESKALTREYIKTALLLLMKEVPFEKITVTSIIERAGVSRAGFYRNFTSKQEVLADFYVSLHQKITPFFMADTYMENPKPEYMKLFTYVKENEEMIQLIQQVLLANYYYIDESPHIKQFYNPQNPEDYYYYTAVVYSRKALLLEWVKNGMKETPEEMADILVKLLHR